jgi:hypothetical protein
MIVKGYFLNEKNGILIIWPDFRGGGIGLAGINPGSPSVVSDQKT